MSIGACSDDEPTPVISESEYLTEVTALCERYLPALDEAREELTAGPFSDAEAVAYYRSDLVPRLRSILRGLRRNGVPASETIVDGINSAAAALQDIEDDPAGLIDRSRDGNLRDEENPFLELSDGLTQARITCAIQPEGFEV